MPPTSDHLAAQLFWLLVLSIPVACMAWTITKEDIFREPREWCAGRSKDCRKLIQRKFFYLFTCEYCFSHYVAILFIILTGYKLLLDDWRGYVLAFFAVVWLANLYMNIYSRLRVDINSERKTIEEKEKTIEKIESEIEQINIAGKDPT